MRRLLVVVALLVGANIAQGPPADGSDVCDDPFDRPTESGSCVPIECPDGTVVEGTMQTCSCELDVGIPVVQWGDDGGMEQFMDPADCPTEPAPPEDCADAPGCVLGVTVKRAPVAAPVPVGVTPAFTG